MPAPFCAGELDKGRDGWHEARPLRLEQDEKRAMGGDTKTGGASSRSQVVEDANAADRMQSRDVTE